MYYFKDDAGGDKHCYFVITRKKKNLFISDGLVIYLDANQP